MNSFWLACIFSALQTNSFPEGISRPLLIPPGYNGDLSLPCLLGDVDNDGIPELAFGQLDMLATTDAGMLHIAFLRNSDLSFQSFHQSQLPLHVPLQTGNLFGHSVCGLGDLDRDGYMDLAVSCPFCNPVLLSGAGSSTSSGGIFLLFLTRPFLNSSLQFDPDKTRTVTAFDLQTTTVGFGHHISPAGDVNQDGVDDLLVSERRLDSGRFWLILLQSDGSVLSSSRFLHTDPRWGLTPRSLGDLDQDGVPDIVAWSPLEIHVMLLGRNGTARSVQVLDKHTVSSDGQLVFPTFGPGQGFQGVEQIGDVDGDGVIDVLISISGTSTLLYVLCLERNGTARLPASVLGIDQDWADDGVTILGNFERADAVQLVGLHNSGTVGLTLFDFTPARKHAQAICFSNPECASGVCAVSSEYSSGELPSAAGVCVDAWMTFSGSQGYALAAGSLGDSFSIDAFLRYKTVPTIRTEDCRDPILSRQNVSNKFIEFSLCILENSLIEFRLNSLAANTSQLVLRAPIPPLEFVHVRIVGDGPLKVLLIQGRVVRMGSLTGQWHGEGYALNLGQNEGRFMKADVLQLRFNGVDLLGEIASPCTDNVCTYPGSCQVVAGRAVCVCPPGTEGDGVECANVNACAVNSCLYGVACLDDIPFSDSYSCAPCPPGTVGAAKYLCVGANFCTEEENPCVHPETCVDLNGTEVGALCSCHQGEVGDGQRNGSGCIDFDSCNPSPCPEGVACVDIKAPAHGYACPGACSNGTAWDASLQRCVDADACLLKPCFPGVACTDLPPPASYALCGTCPPGRAGTGYGANGCNDINTCLPSNPCFQDNCVSLPAEEALRLQALGLAPYYCRPCPTGYEGDGVSCVDINYCLPSNLCFDQATCIDRPAPQLGYDCGACPPGTRGNYGRQCVDIDACLAQPPPCFSGVTCIDEPAPSLGAKCGVCPVGFMGNGSFCEDVNECLSDPCFHNASLNVKVECINLRGSYMCGPCPPNFAGNGKSCVPYGNPCATAPCAGCVQVGIRSFRCTPCERGYITSPNGCLKFDPCSEDPCFKLGNSSSSCVSTSNVNETFRCGPCPEGYVEDKNSRNLCVNYNACNSSSCFPGAECYDMPPPRTDFLCGPCPLGYVGDAKAFACRNYDSCLTHPCYPNVSCTDLPPPSVGAQCGSCPAGRVGDGVRCADYDACSAQPTNCFPEAECIDDPPPSMGYRCGSCPVGYAGDGKVCVFLDVCLSLPCPSATKCRQHGEPLLSRSCTNCPMGFVENSTGGCVDFDACTEHPCKLGKQCHDLLPPSMGFYCTECLFGTVVDSAGTNCTDPNMCLSNPCPPSLLCVDLPGSTGYICQAETQRPTMRPSPPAFQSGIMGEIHFPALSWEAWNRSSSVAEEALREWLRPVLNNETVVELGVADGGTLGGIILVFRMFVAHFSAATGNSMIASVKSLTEGPGPPGFGRGRLLTLRSMEERSPPTLEVDSGVQLWQWILLGIACLLLAICCVGWTLRKRRKRRADLEMQHLRKLQKEREGHQFRIEGDDIYVEGEEPWM